MHGQLVVGAPGAGKSTYCGGMATILEQLKRRPVLVNLDPANDVTPYKCDIDIRQMITVEDVMNKLKLGPNGALRYCMHTLRKNLNWLKERLSTTDGYLLIDMPGQLELYNSDDCVKEIIHSVESWGHRLVAVHLSDSVYCSDVGKFIAVVLAALSVMVNLEAAQVNVLSKMDLVNPNLPFDIDVFKTLPSMSRLLELIDENPALKRYKGMNEAVCSVIEDYSLVNFTGLDVSSKESMLDLLRLADNANGYALVDAADLRNIVLK